MLRNRVTSTVLLLFSTAVYADVLTVDDDGPADYSRIQDAIDAAHDGDEILVEPGSYTADTDNIIDTLGKAITIRSAGGAGVTFIDGESERRGIICQSGETPSTVIEGFTIRACSATWYDSNGNGSVDYWEYFGGGAWVRSASAPTIRNCRFEQNTAPSGYGGGLYIGDENQTSAQPTIIDCVFKDNTTPDGVGGGIYNSYSSPILSNCHFLGNEADYGGGGMLNWNSPSCSLDECVFESNRCTLDGGALYNHQSSATLSNCSFDSNTALNGGGVFNADPGSSAHVPIFNQCFFTGNNASDEGGGMHNFSISPQLIQCRITNNGATAGGGVYSWNSSVPLFQDCLICGNTPNQVSGNYTESDGTMISSTCPTECIGDLNNDGQVDGADLNALLGDWGDSRSPADLDGDGLVDGADLLGILSAWGSCG